MNSKLIGFNHHLGSCDAPCYRPKRCVCSSAGRACRRTWRRRDPGRSSPPTSPAPSRSRSPPSPASPSNPGGRTCRTQSPITKKNQLKSSGCSEARRFSPSPAQFPSEASVEAGDGSGVQVIEVRVTDEDGVDPRQLSAGGGGTCGN